MGIKLNGGWFLSSAICRGMRSDLRFRGYIQTCEALDFLGVPTCLSICVPVRGALSFHLWNILQYHIPQVLQLAGKCRRSFQFFNASGSSCFSGELS